MNLQIKLCDRVRTRDGHCGKVTKIYHVTGVSTPYVHIQEADGRVWYCPISDITTMEGGIVDEETHNSIMDEILRAVSAARYVGHC